MMPFCWLWRCPCLGERYCWRIGRKTFLGDGDVSGKLAASRHFSATSHVGVTGICVIAFSRHSHLWTCGSVCARGSSFFNFVWGWLIRSLDFTWMVGGPLLVLGAECVGGPVTACGSFFPECVAKGSRFTFGGWGGPVLGRRCFCVRNPSW